MRASGARVACRLADRPRPLAPGASGRRRLPDLDPELPLSRILVTPGGPAGSSLGPAAGRAFRVLRWVGLLLAAVTAVDVVLVFIPLQWANADWRLASIVQAFNGMPVLAVGLAAVTAAAAALGERGLARLMTVAHLLVAVAVVVAVLAFLPVATEAVRIARDGWLSDVGRAVIRTIAYALIFGTLHVLLALASRRAARPPAAP